MYGSYTDKNAVAIISNSTFSRNSADLGGAISSGSFFNYSGFQLKNSTVVFNSATTRGGGINLNFSPMKITGNIISGNQSAGSQEIFGLNASVESRYNILGFLDDPGIEGFQLSASDLIHQSTVDALVDINLSDNGGLTKTHALISDSPAIDFVTVCKFTHDQIGNNQTH